MNKHKNENKLVPKLRFPEYSSDKWEIKSIDELCEILNNLRKPLTSTVREKGEYPYYGASGIIDFVKNFIFDERLLLVGEDGAKWGAYERTAFIAEGKYWVNNHAHVLKPIEVVDILLESYLLKLDISPFITGAAPPKLTLGKLKSIPVPIPKNPQEQQKIAACLSSLDEIITAERQKLEVLKEHKKGLLQNLFPSCLNHDSFDLHDGHDSKNQGNQENHKNQGSDNVPKLRFKEFESSGEWEVKKLGEVAIKVGSGSTPLGGESVYKKVGRPFVRSQNVGWGFFLLENIAFIDEETHQNSINTEIQFEDVLLNITGASIGRSAVANEFVTGGNVNQHVCIIRTEKNTLNPLFLNQFLISNFGQMQIDSFQAGGNRQGLNFVQIRSLTIYIPPTLQEQQKIATTLSSIDELIIAQGKKIEALQLHKKGLLQGLFPNVNKQNG